MVNLCTQNEWSTKRQIVNTSSSAGDSRTSSLCDLGHSRQPGSRHPYLYQPPHRHQRLADRTHILVIGAALRASSSEIVFHDDEGAMEEEEQSGILHQL